MMHIKSLLLSVVVLSFIFGHYAFAGDNEQNANSMNCCDNMANCCDNMDNCCDMMK